MRRFGPIWIMAAASAAAAFGDERADPPGKDAAGAPATSPGTAEEPAKAPAAKVGAAAKGSTADPPAAKAPEKAAPESPAPPAPATLEAALLRLSRSRVDVDLREATLADAADFLARVARMNVILSPALRAKGADALPRIDLRLTKVTLRQFAELLAKTTDTKLVLRDGILQFTTPEDARGKPVLRIHVLADLTLRIRNFPGPDIHLHPSGVEFEDEKESEVESAFDDPEEIVETVRKLTGEGTWDDEDVSISADERKLVVRQYPEVQREIARLLALLRAAK